MANKHEDSTKYIPQKITINLQEYEELTLTKKFVDGREIAKVVDDLEEIVRLMRIWTNGFK